MHGFINILNIIIFKNTVCSFWQIVQVFDTYAGELGPALFARYELPMLRAIAMEVKEKLAEKKIDQVPMVSNFSNPEHLSPTCPFPPPPSPLLFFWGGGGFCSLFFPLLFFFFFLIMTNVLDTCTCLCILKACSN